ncbi:hypothetical protein ABZ797_33580 [Streptomyces antimycoticus]|uniref:hypothetical protein n=1 Tax=Streptomyces antimycoticus TaxID=68175 RepID=UPI0033FDFA20
MTTEPTTHAAVPSAPAGRDLRDRIIRALQITRRTDYEGAADHTKHRFDARCALCAYDVDALADAVLAVLPAPRDAHDLDEGHAPLLPEREAEIRETHPGEWYDGPWTQDYVDSNGDEPAYCRVVHQESGTTLATLPDFAGPIALFIADAHDAVSELLAELDRVRAERDKYSTELDRINLERWEDEQPRCTAEYGGPGYTHCELSNGHDGQHESALGNMQRATWGTVR